MKVVVFDTETIGKVSQDLINVGYKIIDIDFHTETYKTILERDYIMTDLINNQVYCLNDDFVGAEKYARFVNAINQKKAVKRNIKSVLKTFDNDLKRNNVLFGYAYNCKFDVDKINKAGYEFKIPVYDIWGYANQYIINTKEYQEWAKLNNQLTPSERFISETVESVSRFLLNDPEFKETHTALDDTQHETAILMECVKRGCDITRPTQKTKRVDSEKVFKKTLIYKGETIELEYTSKREKDGVITLA